MNKYNAKKTIVDGIKFDSKRESECYLILKQKQIDGEITNLDRQVKFELIPKNDLYRAVNYVADFTFYDKNGEYHVIDVKGIITPEFKLKRKMFYAKYKFDIEIMK